MTNHGFASDDPNRLPWLRDELQQPRRRARRNLPRLPLGVLAVPGVLLAVGAAYMLGAANAPTAAEAIKEATHLPLTIRWQPEAFDNVRAEPAKVELAPSEAQAIAPPPVVAATAPRLPQRLAEQAAEEASAPATGSPESDSSFSCRLASSPSQIAVCGNEELLKLDQHLSLFYTQAFTRANAAKRELLLDTRDAFVAWREACRSEACIRGVYTARIREVGGIMAGHIQQSPASASRNRQAPAAAARPPVADASFSCRLARSPSQVAVCRNEELLKLDQHLSLFYTQAFTRADPAKRERLLRTRDEFSAARDQCQSDQCLKTAYLGRIRQVAGILAGQAAEGAP